MALTYCVCGDPGTGKSTSIGNFPDQGIQGLNPKETVLINVSDKPPSFRGSMRSYSGSLLKGGNYLATKDPAIIMKALEFLKTREDIKHIVIDDWQYMLVDQLVKRADDKGYDKYNLFAKVGYMTMTAGSSLRPDQHLIFMCHSRLDTDTKRYRIKTVGKMLDEKVQLDGLFTVVLHTVLRLNEETGRMEYYFATNAMQDDMGNMYNAKSPLGMFNDLLIPNDMGYVVAQAAEYYLGGE